MLRNKLTNRQKMIPRFFLNLYRKKGLAKSWNWVKYDWGVLKKSKLNFVPPVIVATITRQCNLRCPSCLYLLQDENYLSSGMMKGADFYKVLSDIDASKADIIYFSGGEPLLHNDLEYLIQIAKYFNLTVKTSTNGILIKKRFSVLKQFDEINVSLDGYDYESYKKYRGGKPFQFDEIVKGLNLLKIIRKKFSLSFLLSTDNVGKVFRMLDFAKMFSPQRVIFHNINPHEDSNYGSLTIQNKKVMKIMDLLLKNKSYSFEIVVSPIFDVESKEFEESICMEGWYYFCFDDRGCLAPCCHIPHDAQNGMLDYNSNFMQNFRKIIFDDKDWDKISQCQFCQRRFLGKDFMVFNPKKKKWYK